MGQWLEYFYDDDSNFTKKYLLSNFVRVQGDESSNASLKCLNDCSKSPLTFSIRPRRRWTSLDRIKSGLTYSNCWNAFIDLKIMKGNKI